MILFLGCLAMFITVVLDIFESNQLIGIGGLIPLGTFWLLLAQSLVLAVRFSNAFTRVNEMSESLEQANVALKKVDRLKDEILANTTHEIRTPLHGIIGIAESMMDNVESEDRENLDIIISSGKRLTALLNDILDLSRIREGDLKLNIEPVNIREVVDFVCRLSLHLIGTKPIELNNQVSNDCPAVDVDVDRFQQVLLNVIGNAIKYTHKGEIVITAKAVEKKIQISISDTGIGFHPNDNEKIFQTCTQLDGSVTRMNQGAGLGLSITRQLLEIQKGSITVESQPGYGTTFNISLPIAEGLPKGHSDLLMTPAVEGFYGSNNDLQTHLTYPPKLNPQKILIVDDNVMNLKVVSQFLSHANYQIYHAVDGETALEIIEKSGKPDLILLDIMMPGSSGFEICQKIREKHSAYELPIIFLTAKTQETDMERSFFLGGNDFLTKPFSKNELLCRVRNQLGYLQAASRTSALLKIRRELSKFEDNAFCFQKW